MLIKIYEYTYSAKKRIRKNKKKGEYYTNFPYNCRRSSYMTPSKKPESYTGVTSRKGQLHVW